MQTVTVDVGLRGMEPGLLMNSPKMMGVEAENGKPKTRTAEKKGKEEEAEDRAYRTDDGDLYLPSEAVFSMLVNAATKLKRKVGKGTYKDAVPGYLTIQPFRIPFVSNNGNDAGYAIDSRRVRINRGGSIICHRPHLPEWEVSFQLQIDDVAELPIDVVQTALELGGRRIGILDFRPQCKGPFGRFEVTKFEVVESN